MNIHMEELQQESGKNSYLLFVEQIRDSLSHQTPLTSNSDNKDRTQNGRNRRDLRELLGLAEAAGADLLLHNTDYSQVINSEQ